MTMLVHLADARDAARIRRSGLRGQATHIYGAAKQSVELDAAVYCTPVLPNHFASHQWLRELKRRGIRTISGVYFRLRADLLVWVGRYNGEHTRMRLGCATRIFIDQPDPRGWELIVPRSIRPEEVHAIREVPQVIGWRYFPEAHEQGPVFLCEYCTKGEIKGRRLRERGMRRSASPADAPA